jgi:hypothetical protein
MVKSLEHLKKEPVTPAMKQIAFPSLANCGKRCRINKFIRRIVRNIKRASPSISTIFKLA